MTAADLLPVSGWIMPSRRGTFEHLAEAEPGAINADFLHVIEGDDLIDTVAWERSKPGVWWLRHDLITHVGGDELAAAWWDERPARMLETPAAYVDARGGGFCIVDWSADINAVVGRVAAVECATPALYKRLRETLIQQAMPRGLSITIASNRRAAA